VNYLISDTHFNHANIIKYCDRPFRDVEEMNQTLVENWNKTVNEDDTVFFLGDLAFRSDPLAWLELLNGKIVFIGGQHDRFFRGTRKSLVLHSEGVDLLLIHNPADTPEDWHGWVVHGHKHNTAPLIDPFNKRVNVSVEVIDYTPISVSRVVSMIRAHEQPRPVYAKLRLHKRPSVPELRGVR